MHTSPYVGEKKGGPLIHKQISAAVMEALRTLKGLIKKQKKTQSRRISKNDHYFRTLMFHFSPTAFPPSSLHLPRSQREGCVGFPSWSDQSDRFLFRFWLIPSLSHLFSHLGPVYAAGTGGVPGLLIIGGAAGGWGHADATLSEPSSATASTGTSAGRLT